MTDVKEIRRRRAELKQNYGAAYSRLAEILFRADPVGVCFEGNTDEYEPEVGTILPRLRGCGSSDDVRQVVMEEFAIWFDEVSLGPKDRYTAIAEQVWTEVVPLLK